MTSLIHIRKKVYHRTRETARGSHEFLIIFSAKKFTKYPFTKTAVYDIIKKKSIGKRGQREKCFFTRVLRLSLFCSNGFSRQNQLQFPKERNAFINESHDTMKKNTWITAGLLTALLASQMCFTVSAADEIILISPKPAATGEDILICPNPAAAEASPSADAIVDAGYDRYAGMCSYDGVANRLNSIGVLRGDGDSFNLDDLPDRQQACVMVVRMRGEEEEALAAYEAGETVCPFTDVEDAWAKPYLAWLYEKGITMGVGDNAFGNGLCSAQEYITFMLRALGYQVTWDEEEGTDVLYADVLEFARTLHLWDGCLAAEPQFDRGVMSAVTYQTLAADVKGTYERLLSALVNDGAIREEVALPILALYDAVDTAAAIERAATPMLTDGVKTAGHMKQEEYYQCTVMGTASDDAAQTAYTGMDFDFAVDFTEGRQEYALEGEVAILLNGAEMTVPMSMWLHDSTVYVDVLGQKECSDAENTDEIDQMTAAFGEVSSVFTETAYRYYSISDVSVETSDGTDENGAGGTLVVYDVTDFMWPIIVSALDTTAFTENALLSVVAAAEKYIDETGILACAYNGMYAMLSETDAESGATMIAEILNETTVDYTAWGDDVVFSYPDFSQFQTTKTEAAS